MDCIYFFMDKDYVICKNRLASILEEKETIPFLKGKETDIDNTLKEELNKKFPDYLTNFKDNQKRYSRLAEKVLIEFCEKGRVFQIPGEKKYKILERFSVERYRYFVSEGLD
jgi:hypothetical protein